ncbi:glucuronyl hydrolase [Pseudomonas sp. MAFF 302030]|uniref:Glucuronyl hydrolase n=1 Tax=Pseudomonas morbosilactucae TaxID=2938197 RepID=A0A9X2C6A4_9PSED|nr:glucuronyl hydrolase [Pseudomonas morbosilactucae]MCK9798083.1 glucuronyl hydrolase [Pseudomonas morbosilactucae]
MDTDTQNRSLIYWYGAALGDRCFGDAYAKSLAEQAALRLAESWRDSHRCLPLGCAMGGGESGSTQISIDPLASTVQLLTRYANEQARQRLRHHLHTVARTLGDGRGAYAAHADLPAGTDARREVGNWSRGQAWAMLGLARAATHLAGPYVPLAEQAADYWLASRPESLALNRLDQPDGEYDPCATVIAALAMQTLAPVSSRQSQWRVRAAQLLTSVVRSPYFSREGKDAGSFVGLCYGTAKGVEERVESPCSSFFLLAALLIMAERLDPSAV